MIVILVCEWLLESDFHSLCVNQRSLASIFARLGCHGIMSQGQAPQQALFTGHCVARRVFDKRCNLFRVRLVAPSAIRDAAAAK
jgi:hypothetical protein